MSAPSLDLSGLKLAAAKVHDPNEWHIDIPHALPLNDDDIAFVIAASPNVVLALISELEAARGLLTEQAERLKTAKGLLCAVPGYFVLSEEPEGAGARDWIARRDAFLSNQKEAGE